MPDTNVYLHHEDYFDEIGWRKWADASDEVRISVPMAVVRELDRAKRASGNKRVSEANDEPVRTRARVSSRKLRTFFEYPTDVMDLQDKVTIDLLIDPVGHRAQDDPDSEIIDRALALKTVSHRRVAIVTGDGNMQFMAKVAGLEVVAIQD